jgi:hypothetical protein
VCFFFLIFFFLLFMCAYKAWVISPPCPHPLPYHPLCPLPLPPKSIFFLSNFRLISEIKLHDGFAKIQMKSQKTFK